MQTLRIAVCNLQSGIGTTRGYWHYLTTAWKYRLPHDSAPQIGRAAKFMRRAQVDIAALCEIDGGCRRSRWRDQLDMLCRASGLRERVFFPTRVVGRRVNQGNAVCSRFPTRYIGHHALPGVGEPRFLSESEIELNGQSVRLLVTHLSLERTLRTPQILRIARLVDEKRVPTILAGDFNITEQAELNLLRESVVLDEAVTGATFPAWGPRRYLDHLFLSAHFELRGAWVFDAFLFSDHLPLLAEVVMREEPPGPPRDKLARVWPARTMPPG